MPVLYSRLVNRFWEEKKNDCFAVLAGIQQNNDNIYENTDLEFACNLTSLVTIFFFFSMDVELQLTPIFFWCYMK